ncbi:hypothetical protein RRG08_066546 [Elysia crispata]|uniref:Uncharacterized protein n=1 Tax=Elysia crispata TaxID=231223 RepID=A0AAE1AQE0_9GAST|nr:hypothetical protein RRG08_066546 [Elysia crispata]
MCRRNGHGSRSGQTWRKHPATFPLHNNTTRTSADIQNDPIKFKKKKYAHNACNHYKTRREILESSFS